MVENEEPVREPAEEAGPVGRALGENVDAVSGLERVLDALRMESLRDHDDVRFRENNSPENLHHTDGVADVLVRIEALSFNEDGVERDAVTCQPLPHQGSSILGLM